MREVELKGVMHEPDKVLAALAAAGAELTYEGRLEDRRYDTPDRSLMRRDHLLRLRVYRDASGSRALLDYKGPTEYEHGYKVREELSTGAADADELALILGRLGYVVTREIDRHITQFRCRGAIVRIERYPRMDTLVEVEGAPEAIEAAIAATGLPRAGFSTERLPDFILRFEARTGERAAVCDREMLGDYRFSAADA
jgi:predicted adenylyl cyclase CyaB